MTSDLSKGILQELRWQPLMERWGNNKAIFMHKDANGEYPGEISNLFVIKNAKDANGEYPERRQWRIPRKDNYNLRNNGIDYTPQKPRTNFLKKALLIVVQKCGTSYQWN